MKKPLDLFKIKKEERWQALVALLIFIALNALTIIKYYDPYSSLTDNYHKLFVRTFHVSGFDPLTYSVVSNWETGYNVFRHPLLAFFMYIPNQINQGLMMLTGHNCVQFVVAALLVFCAFYSFIFLYRIFREVMDLPRVDATLLSAFYFSFAYVMVSTMVPDHFVLSMMMLLMTLYISGMCMKRHRKLKGWQTILLFVFTAGISLNNGLKTFMAALFVKGKRFFRPRYLVFAILVPAALIWLFAKFEYRTFVWPKEMARKEARMKKDKELRQKIYTQYADTASTKDSAQIAQGVKAVIAKKVQAKFKRDHRQPWNAHKGKPITQGEFMGWTDISTSRCETAVENLFGESIQLHRQHLLQDTLIGRPVIVKYDMAISYAVEAIIVLLFIIGIIVGYRSKFLWLTLSFFLFDMILHMGLGFGINEVYIMAAHWIYAIPIAIGFLMQRIDKSFLKALRILLVVLTLYLWIYNGWLLTQYML